MGEVEQDVMCVLLRTLLDKELITQEIHDKSRSKILSTRDWPGFFCYSEDAGKKDADGST